MAKERADHAPDDEPVPIVRSRFGRVVRFGALAASAAGSAVLGKAESAVADETARVLGNLRGLAAKVGQMASYVDGIVPEDKRDAFEASLKVLRTQAPRSRAEDIRALIELELGAPVSELFAEWSDVPIASASIGQVHRARLPQELGGFEVAVKVQHPGIREAVESDLASAKMLESLGAIALPARRFDTKRNFELLQARFREELDYALEAERVVAFSKIHEGDPKIVVPRLVAERSAASVLTTELVHGRTLDDVLGESEPAKRAWAETLWRFVFKGNLVGGMFNADPHPGNYLFQDDGRIAFLDYGCVQKLAKREQAVKVHRAAIDGDQRAFERHFRDMLSTKPGELERMATAYTRLCFEPLFGSPYRVTRGYAASLVTQMKAMALAARKVPIDEVFTMPPEMLFMNRLQFGFYSVLARLDVAVDYAAVERAFLPDA